VKTLINAFPSALSHVNNYKNDDEEDDKMMLPIQAACWNHRGNSIPFIPLLAVEGMERNIGGEGQRGGLLAEDDGANVLHFLAGHVSSAHDSMCLDVLKRLRQSDLFKKEDIRDYNLLHLSCQPSAKERFEYLVDWDPKALKEYQYTGEPFLHDIIIDEGSCAIVFGIALRAGMKHYPGELGFLFGKNDAGKTACELAFEHYDKDEAWGKIEECFEETHDVKMVEWNPVTN